MTRSLLLFALTISMIAAQAAPALPEAETNTPPLPPSLTLLQHLQATTPPVFRAGHTLLPLARWGWSMPFAVRIELAERWGYALEFAGYVTHASVDAIEQHPDGDNARIVALAASDPKRYPLAVLTHRPLGGNGVNDIPEALRTAYHVCDADGKPIPDDRSGAPSWRTVSPLAPDAIFEWAARGTVEPLARLQAKAPLALIFNGGEYGLSVSGHSRTFWQKSPAVVAAKGDLSWLTFISQAKARQEGIISNAIRTAFPDRTLFLWYHFAGIPSWDDERYSNGPELLAVSDLPDQSLYYLQFNTGWSGNRDLLSNFTHALAQAIALNHPLSYNWVCGGWLADTHSPRDRYLGFLKCLYAAGQVGAVAGYFSVPQGLDGKPVGAETPAHLQQMMDLGQAHAIFSHVDEFLRDGDLLPGPFPHARDSSLPSYEFADPATGIRIFARRHHQRDAWLIVAWAATGEARSVTVDIPELGPVELLARPAGSVYLASSRQETDYEPPVVTLDLLDADPMDPTARWR